ncbi:patatin-domain-containing protein [Serendipita vermifera]|nr:patatin-domain-containing protein [Serendipita vermifera]
MPLAGPSGDDLEANFIDESHIESFAAALQADDEGSDAETSGPTSPIVPPTPKPGRVRKISALSDFAPIQTKVKRSGKRRRIKTGTQREFIFQLARWPLLFFIGIVIFGEFGLYVAIRQIVNTMEWLFAWRGRKYILRQKLRNAKTYEEWKEAALTLDNYLGFDEWKEQDEDPYYDYLLVKKVRRSLRILRQKNDARGVLGVLDLCLRANFAGTESSRLYSETFYGTKKAIESYITEVESAIDFVRRSPSITLEEKRRFFKSTNRNVGSSALCLSGGATFGYYHFGVVKALLDEKLLPRVIAGTSCGSLIAALVCTRTDAELEKLLVPELAHKITACEEGFLVWFRRFLTTGARFDTVDWARKTVFFTRGSMTFREAYELTGRVLNVSVIPFDRHSPTKLLNYLTAPDCVIWSAVIASAAVPGILNPVVLMQKSRTGAIVPWNWGSRFKDGSLRVDVPLQSLNLLFNVSHPIVSQVNPHVHLFFFASRGSAGRPVARKKGKGNGGFLLSAAEQFLKHDLTKNFKVIRDLELMPQLLGQDWSSVFLQKFEGSVTILPKTRLMDWVQILSDPSVKELERKLCVGQQVTWPRMHMIENRMRIERKILRGRLDVKRASRARGDKTPVEGSSEPPNNLQAALSSTAVNNADNSSGGAGHTDFESSYPFPAFLASELIAVESDREAGFAAGSERFFKRPHGSGRAHRRGASHGLAQIQVPTGQRIDLPEITIQAGTPDTPRQSSRDQFSTMPSPIRRRRWGSSLSNVFSLTDPATAPLPRSDEVSWDRQTTQAPLSAAEPVRPMSFLARLRSTSFNAITSPLSRIGSSNKEADARSLASLQLQEAGWSSDSSSEDEFIWNGGETAPAGISSFAMEVGEDEEVAWGAGQNIRQRPREDEDADLTGEIPESP